MRFRCFGLPCWDCTRVHSVAETSDPSSDDKLCEAVGGCLDRGADDHDDGADEDCLFAAEHVSEPDCSYGAEEAAEGVCTDLTALETKPCTGLDGLPVIAWIVAAWLVELPAGGLTVSISGKYLKKEPRVSRPPITP